MYHNYKGYASVVLMAVDIGSYRKDCDSNMFKRSSLWASIENNEQQLPPDRPLQGTDSPVMPYFLVGDEAFALQQGLL